MIRKLLPLLLILTLVLVACGGPDVADAPAEVVAAIPTDPPAPPTVVEAAVEPVEAVVADAGCADDWDASLALSEAAECPANWGVLYLEVTGHTVLWELVDEIEDIDGNITLVFERHEPYIHYVAGEIIIAYNGLGAEEYYYNLYGDGTLFLGVADFPNAQEFSDEDGLPEFIGRYVGLWIDVEGNLRGDARHFYKVAGGPHGIDGGAGLYVLAEDVLIPECENLVLSYPESCSQ